MKCTETIFTELMYKALKYMFICIYKIKRNLFLFKKVIAFVWGSCRGYCCWNSSWCFRSYSIGAQIICLKGCPLTTNQNGIKEERPNTIKSRKMRRKSVKPFGNRSAIESKSKSQWQTYTTLYGQGTTRIWVLLA